MMLRLLLLAAVVYILYKWLRRSDPPVRKPQSFDPPEHKVEEMVQDQSCGTWVPVGEALTLDHDKETKYFCSAECREKFLQAHPEFKR